jgi:hypothetical protein
MLPPFTNFTLKVKARSSTGTLIVIYQISLRHASDDSNLKESDIALPGPFVLRVKKANSRYCTEQIYLIYYE